jgi:serine O-acetyltransferase
MPQSKSSTTVLQQLLDSYQEVGLINHLDGENLPSRAVVPDICHKLLQLLFPGFLGDDALVRDQVSARTVSLLGEVTQLLQESVERSLRCSKTLECGRCAEAARDRVGQFLAQMPAVRSMLQTDVQAAFDGDPAAGSLAEIVLSYPFIEAVAIQRLAHVLYGLEIPLLPRMMTEWAHSRTGIDIHPGAQIGSHFFIDHGTGVVIGETCVIGDHVKLYQGVGLVARSLAAGQALKGKRRHPTIEDHVTIYANATIVGGDTIIGARSTIGASVFLMNSVPVDSVVIMEPQTQTRSKKGKM